MAKQKPVEIVVIMDRSGSMSAMANEAVNGYNTFIAEQRAIPGAANVTLALFDNRYEVVYDAVKLTKNAPAALTVQVFAPNGMTAMNDAIGRALVALEKKNPEKAVICILTDGHENASKEYTGAAVAAKIRAAEDRGWEIVFLAANIDVKQAAQRLGITRGYSAPFSGGVGGATMAYATMSVAASAYRTQ